MLVLAAFVLQIVTGVSKLLMTGIGSTDTTTLCGLLQPFAVIVYTYVTLTADAVVLVRISLTFPVPLEAAWLIPATEDLLQVNVDPTVALVAV